MRLKIWAAVILFMGSYLPLSIILLAQNFQYERLERPFCWPYEIDCSLPFRQPVISLSFFLICSICFFLTWLFIRSIKPRQKMQLVEIKHIPTDLMNYVLPYVVSFMGIDYADPGKLMGFIVFLVWMFVLVFKSDRIIMNPILVVLGWKLYEVKHKAVGGDKVLVSMALSKVSLEPGCIYRMDSVQDVLIVK